MKKIIYQAAAMGVLCLAFSYPVFAQAVVTPPPPPAKQGSADKSEQKEIIIRQKGDKDTKITVEIKNGDLLINGKPADKFDDKDIIIEKRDIDNDDIIEIPELSYSPSPFREREWEDAGRAYERAQLDRQLNDLGRQRNIEKSIKVRMNEAFLGVSSKKTDKTGASVLEVTKGSPAEKAGIKKDDLITKVNDTKIDGPESLFETIHNYKVGDKVKIVLIRGGKEQTVTATLEKADQMFPKDFKYNYNYNFKMPPMPPMEIDGMHIRSWGAPRLGIKAQDTEDGKGVNILEVEDSSAAAKAGLKKGDIILQFDGKAVNSTGELVEDLQDARQKAAVKVKIQRAGVMQELEVKIPRKLKTADL
jgi:serine protease Do